MAVPLVLKAVTPVLNTPLPEESVTASRRDPYVGSSMAWEGHMFKNEDSFIFCLTPEDIDEVNTALKAFQGMVKVYECLITLLIP